MKRNQAYVLLVGLLIVVLFLAGLYWSSQKASIQRSINEDNQLQGLSPLVITPMTPLKIEEGELLPISINNLQVKQVQVTQKSTILVLLYRYENRPNEISLEVQDTLNFIDEAKDSRQIAHAELNTAISMGQVISLDFFINSSDKPVSEQTLLTYLQNLNTQNTVSLGDFGTNSVGVADIMSAFENGGQLLDARTIKIITIQTQTNET